MRVAYSADRRADSLVDSRAVKMDFLLVAARVYWMVAQMVER